MASGVRPWSGRQVERSPRVTKSSSPAGSAAHISPILLLFIGSGCAALLYEIVWFQVLQLVIGASAVSLAVLLGAFMGGMFAGSLLAR